MKQEIDKRELLETLIDLYEEGVKLMTIPSNEDEFDNFIQQRETWEIVVLGKLSLLEDAPNKYIFIFNYPSPRMYLRSGLYFKPISISNEHRFKNDEYHRERLQMLREIIMEQFEELKQKDTRNYLSGTFCKSEEKQSDILKKKVGECFSTRVASNLKWDLNKYYKRFESGVIAPKSYYNPINTIEELISFTKKEIRRRSNIGLVSINEIEKFLAQHNLQLKKDNNND